MLPGEGPQYESSRLGVLGLFCWDLHNLDDHYLIILRDASLRLGLNGVSGERAAVPAFKFIGSLIRSIRESPSEYLDGLTV
ncbi:hypothetical protein RvY_07654 [Ramazzottius varieornatus]|uniref:Uncharacterized protein n=1 Tax=Ramazzottius varieornatus TaxID=947166 RepID=A0A1D1V2Z1_RAMVA|nr:hypothetical protein RvY_07654 [Ramazzottius varieornatus]